MNSLRVTCLSMLAAVVLAGCQAGFRHGVHDALRYRQQRQQRAQQHGHRDPVVAGPDHHTNGQALTDLAGYRIYYGTGVNDLSRTIRLTSVGIQTYVIDNLTTGTWHFGISAITNSGVESGLSDIVSKTIG